MENIGRRAFIGGSVTAGLGLLLAGCSSPQPATSGDKGADNPGSEPGIGTAAPKTYESDEVVSCDVVVVGAGISGLSASLQAAEQGLKAVLLEKEAVLSGTMAGTEGIFGMNSKLQIAANLPMPTRWELIETELEYTNWRTNSLLWEDVLDAAGEDVDWLADHGATFDTVDNYLNQSSHDTFHWWEGGNGGIAGQAVGAAVQAAGVDVRMSTPAVGLVVDGGKVGGVYAQDTDGKITEFDAKAVILACGGLANNLELLAQKTGRDLDGAMSVFPIHDEGDGLVMATEAGARETPISFMNVFSVRGYAPTDAIAAGSTLQPTEVFVNADGSRFMPEDLYIKKFFALVTNVWESQGAVYCVFDQAFVDRMEQQGCICGVAAVKAGDKLEGFGAQLDDASASADSGVFKGDTLDDLAKAAGIDAATLKATMEAYNKACADGVDEQFNKSAEYLVPMEQGPFYAVNPVLAVFATMGGIDVDRQMRVLDMDGQPIPGLYSSGSASCGLYKETYCYQVSGGMNAYCCYSGREAVRQAFA